MALRGLCIETTDTFKPRAAITVAQWIGASNVMRNQKIASFNDLLHSGNGDAIGQSYADISSKEALAFLKDIPVQILRNAASAVYADAQAAKKGLRKFPKKKGRNKKRSCIITRELFIIEPLTDESCLLTLFDSAKKTKQKLFSIKLPYRQHSLGAQFRISRQGRRFYLSGTYDDGAVNVTNKDLLNHAHENYNADALSTMVEGVDRGVVLPVCTSEGIKLAYHPNQTKKIKELAAKKARYQRILAKKKRLNKNKTKRPESNRQRKLADKISTIDKQTGSIRNNFLHQTSATVAKQALPIIALEKLRVKNMVKRAKPKKDATGRHYVRNRANAKTGLNRTLHNVALGKLGDYIKYKANDYGKAVIDVDAAYTSRTCHVCGGRNTERPKQDVLICLDGCGTFHADKNAAIIIKQRAISDIVSKAFADKAKSKKTIAPRKRRGVHAAQVGTELAPRKASSVILESEVITPAMV